MSDEQIYALAREETATFWPKGLVVKTKDLKEGEGISLLETVEKDSSCSTQMHAL